MNRRAFFSSLAAIAATATLDPEKLLWVPGKKLISIPAPLIPIPPPLTNEILALEEFTRRYIVPAMETLMRRMEEQWGLL